MPTPSLFAQCPPFPTTVPTADLPILSFGKLLSHDAEEEKRPFDACREQGLFQLDLQSSPSGEKLLQDAEKMFDLTTATLNLEKSVLSQYAYNPPKDLTGYKAAGLLKTDDGKLDPTELYTMSQDDIIGNTSPRKNPEHIENRRADCKTFFQNSHSVVSIMLGALDTHLDLEHGTLGNLCPLDKVSDTSLRLLVTRPNSLDSTAEQKDHRITLGGHTDIGTITMLFHVAGGLQILPAGAENVFSNWRYVKPEPGCALMNLGDTMVEWTGGLLQSALHRVVTAPGAQAAVARQSLAYLVRPERSASMARLEHGNVIPNLREGEQRESRSPSEWAAWRSLQIIRGELIPKTHGGKLSEAAQL